MVLGETMKISHINLGILIFILLLPFSILESKEADSLRSDLSKNMKGLPKIDTIIGNNTNFNLGLKKVINFADSLLFNKKTEESLTVLNNALKAPFLVIIQLKENLCSKYMMYIHINGISPSLFL